MGAWLSRAPGASDSSIIPEAFPVSEMPLARLLLKRENLALRFAPVQQPAGVAIAPEPASSGLDFDDPDRR